MDVDISDILDSISKPAQLSSTAAGLASSSNLYDTDPTLSSQTDHQLLVKTWTSERSSPSLLPYPTSLINRTTTRISAQITKIEDLTSGISTDQTITKKGRSQNTNLILSILQTDLSRTQFILRSYLRQRLSKITKHAVYYLTLHNQHNSTSTSSITGQDTKTPLLSPAELQFLTHHQSLLSEFYDSSFLSGFPVNLRRLDDKSGGVVKMVEGPDVDVGVVVRCLAEAEWGNEEFLMPQQEEGEEDGDRATVELRMRRGEVWVVRWRDVRAGVVGGDLELL